MEINILHVFWSGVNHVTSCNVTFPNVDFCGFLINLWRKTDELLFTYVVTYFCLHMLRRTFVYICCDVLLFTYVVTYFCLHMLWCTFVYTCCDVLLFTYVVTYFCLHMLWRTFVYICCDVLLFTYVVTYFCLHMLWRTFVYICCDVLLFTYVIILHIYKRKVDWTWFNEKQLNKTYQQYPYLGVT